MQLRTIASFSDPRRLKIWLSMGKCSESLAPPLVLIYWSFVLLRMTWKGVRQEREPSQRLCIFEKVVLLIPTHLHLMQAARTLKAGLVTGGHPVSTNYFSLDHDDVTSRTEKQQLDVSYKKERKEKNPQWTQAAPLCIANARRLKK